MYIITFNSKNKNKIDKENLIIIVYILLKHFMTQKIIIKSYFVNKLVIRGEIIYLFDKEFLNPFILLII